MRRIFACLLAALLVLSVVACGDSTSEPSSTPSAPLSDPTSAPSGSDPSTTTAIATSTTAGGTTETTTAPDASATSTTKTKIPTTTTNKPTAPDTAIAPIEKPVTVNTAILYNKKSSSFDATAEARRQSILNTKDTLKAAAGSNTYYISYRGNDTNNGLSKNTPFKTAARLASVALVSGDVVLFERGGVYRDVSIRLTSGVSLGAYGSGPKPQLLGSEKNFADKSLWKETSTKNVWSTTVSDPAGAPASIEDVGNIVFDHGKAVASPGKKLALKSVKNDLDFYYDATKNTVYLYYSKGNPGAAFDAIDVCTNEHIIRMFGGNNTIENLCVKYGSAHGISGVNLKNVTIRGCEVGWIGGGMLTKTVRYGNGIEFIAGNGHLVENNWIYQCYDAGYTNQGGGWHDNITVRGNLMEYSLYNIEVWTDKEVGKGGMRNCTFEDNYLRFAGFGFSSKAGRIGSDTSVVGNISMYDYVVPCENTVIKNNVLDTSYRHLASIAYPNDTQGRGPKIIGNTWIQQPFSNGDSNATVGKNKITGKTYTVKSQADLETGVNTYDLSPKQILFENAE